LDLKFVGSSSATINEITRVFVEITEPYGNAMFRNALANCATDAYEALLVCNEYVPRVSLG
jgi:hypothetical protein